MQERLSSSPDVRPTPGFIRYPEKGGSIRSRFISLLERGDPTVIRRRKIKELKIQESSPLYDFFRELEELEKGARPLIIIPRRQGMRVVDIRPVVDLRETEKLARHTARGEPPLGRFERMDPCAWWESQEEIERIQKTNR